MSGANPERKPKGGVRPGAGRPKPPAPTSEFRVSITQDERAIIEPMVRAKIAELRSAGTKQND